MSRALLFLVTALALFVMVAPARAKDLEQERVDRLEALGYVEAVPDDPDPSRRGVVARDDRAWDGVNYYCGAASVRFLDMDGRLLHEIPLSIPPAANSGCLADPYRDGLVAVVRRPILSVEEMGGKTVWARRGPFHHDVGVDAEGRLYALTVLPGKVRRNGKILEILGQAITVLSADGRIARSIDLMPLFGDRIPEARYDSIERLSADRGKGKLERKKYTRATDVFHPNSIEVVRWPHAESAGTQVLLSFRDLDLLAVVDLDEPKVLWAWGAADLVGPHDPWLLPNGHVVVFDNGARQHDAGKGRSYSRIVEIDPATNRIVWQYTSEPRTDFFSSSRGGAQPLPNGNVLVTESTKGRVFEVTRGGEIVWDYWNTDFRESDGQRRTIYRMYRMSHERFAELRAGKMPLPSIAAPDR
ncbi:MAG: hypothetical protein FJ144_21215 [Deltaproteobacteria bacterium]|nr:hypothetical protein [Deltaproteobacteria bacterium]